MTEEILPILFTDRWLIKLAEGWRPKFVFEPEMWNAGHWVVVLWRPV
jgi:hypothetical protein